MIPQPSTQTLVEQLHPDCTLTWSPDRSQVVTVMRGSSDAMIDAWADRSIEIRKSWPNDKPMQLILDMRNSESTKHSEKRSAEIAKVRPELNTYFAVVLKSGLRAQLISLVFRGLRLTGSKVQFFFSIPDAQRWIARAVGRLSKS